MTVYYNEFDPFAAEWLQELIKAGLIAAGDVDTRSITDVRPDDLRGYSQCHFFAGIGGWSYALRLAGWPDDRPVWTGSCPCQPFSSAGNQKGKADERHLWPVWFNLIRECRPKTIFGEQVASSEVVGQELETSFAVAVQRGDYAEANRIANKLVKQSGFSASSRWLDDVYQGLEAEGYSCGSAVLPACSAGAPHKRDRLWFVAHASGQRVYDKRPATNSGQESRVQSEAREQRLRSYSWEHGEHILDVVHTINEGSQGHTRNGEDLYRQGWVDQEPSGSAWSSGVWIDCPDGKQRLAEPSIPLLAHGVSNRVGKLRGYGNAIVPQVAATFIRASMCFMLMISPAFAQVQIAEPVTVDFSVTVISMASNDDQFQALGCELNKETNIVEC